MSERIREHEGRVERARWPRLPSGGTRVVAEMACAHEGGVERALAIAGAAADSGADAIQLQLFQAEQLVSRRLPAFEQAKQLELSPESWRAVFAEARSRGLECWANVFDEASLALAVESGASVLKLHSTDLSNPRMLDAVGASGRPLSVAVGGSTLNEIDSALERLRGRGAEQLVLMHGFQAYPTSPADSHLRFLATLRRVFDLPVGYQDHTDGGSLLAFVLPSIAIGLGAAVIEKHITDDRSRRGIDHEASLGPEDFSRFVASMRGSDESLGLARYRTPAGAEAAYRERMKKCVVAARGLPEGHILTESDLVFVRSSPGGVSPARADELVGGRLRRAVDAHENLMPADVASTEV